MTDAKRNRSIIEGLFAELGRGNPRPFRDAMADDISWTSAGSSPWSRVFRGKEELLKELFAPVHAQLERPVQLTVQRIVADGDHVVVEASGRATTKTGEPYNNQYCMVYRLAGGRIVEVTEYMDTQLACARLTPPWTQAAS